MGINDERIEHTFDTGLNVLLSPDKKRGAIIGRPYLSVYCSINRTFRLLQKTETLLCHHLSVSCQTSTFSEFDR